MRKKKIASFKWTAFVRKIIKYSRVTTKYANLVQ